MPNKESYQKSDCLITVVVELVVAGCDDGGVVSVFVGVVVVVGVFVVGVIVVVMGVVVVGG